MITMTLKTQYGNGVMSYTHRVLPFLTKNLTLSNQPLSPLLGSKNHSVHNELEAMKQPGGD